MFYYSGQKKHSSSWNQMVKYSTLRTEMGLRMRRGKTMKKKNPALYERLKANGAFL